MLRAADATEAALDATIAVKDRRTGDMGAPLGIEAFTDHVVRTIA